MREHTNERKKICKALTCIHTVVSDEVFTRIMACDTSKRTWDTLSEAFQGNERTRQMQVLNLRREFELLKMKESENIKEYWNKLLNVVKKIRLIGEQFPDQVVVQKVLVTTRKNGNNNAGKTTVLDRNRCRMSKNTETVVVSLKVR